MFADWGPTLPSSFGPSQYVLQCPNATWVCVAIIVRPSLVLQHCLQQLHFWLLGQQTMGHVRPSCIWPVFTGVQLAKPLCCLQALAGQGNMAMWVTLPMAAPTVASSEAGASQVQPSDAAAAANGPTNTSSHESAGGCKKLEPGTPGPLPPKWCQISCTPKGRLPQGHAKNGCSTCRP